MYRLHSMLQFDSRQSSGLDSLLTQWMGCFVSSFCADLLIGSYILSLWELQEQMRFLQLDRPRCLLSCQFTRTVKRVYRAPNLGCHLKSKVSGLMSCLIQLRWCGLFLAALPLLLIRMTLSESSITKLTNDRRVVMTKARRAAKKLMLKSSPSSKEVKEDRNTRRIEAYLICFC